MANVETLNFQKMTHADIKRHLDMQFASDDLERARSPMCILGKAGIGKTEGIIEYCKENDLEYREIRLLVHEPTDLTGVPYLTGKEGDTDRRTKFAAPIGLFPPPDDSPEAEEIRKKKGRYRGILVLDEITSCAADLRAACYQLLDASRSIAEYKFPSDWIAVCLGNGPEDGGHFLGMESALPNRCYCAYLEATSQDWLKWARNNDIHPAVTAYIEAHPKNLHTLESDDDNEYAGASLFASPRSWTKASFALRIMENYANMTGTEVTTRDVEIEVGGFIGEKVVNDFATFYSYNRVIDNPVDIMSGKIKAVSEEVLKHRENGVKYYSINSLTDRLSHELKGLSMYGGNGTKVADEAAYVKLYNTIAYLIATITKYQHSVGGAVEFVTTGWHSIGQIRLVTELLMTEDESDLDGINPVAIKAYQLLNKFIDSDETMAISDLLAANVRR